MRNGRIRIVIPTPSVSRRRFSSVLRFLILLFFLTVVWLQLYIANLGSSSSQPLDANESSAAVLSMVPKVLHKYLTPRLVNNSSEVHRRLSRPLNISQMQTYIDRINDDQIIHNEDIFGPLQNHSLVIVVQVHTRITYLRHLIVSLAQAKDIETVLLIFSHDHYDEDMNELVESIDFCKVLQIFYPFAIQTHPHTFPGPSSHDCPRDINKDQAVRMNCFNALWPDLYGHYREARFTQTKHHWWWKINRVFNQLEATRDHTGLVLFLEEDHYVAEDFIYILHLMQQTAHVTCNKCNIYSLGTYLKAYNYYSDSKKREALRAMQRHASRGSMTSTWSFQVLPSLYQHNQKVEVTPWVSSKHNMGMALNRSTWQQIRACSRYFCSYDDYNWDWSLQHVSNQCLENGKLHAMMARGPRVFHIGECGVHHKKQNCEATAVISRVQQVMKVARTYLFPSHITLIYTTNHKKQKVRKGNGGWGDPRDHQLCLNISTLTR